MAVTKSQLDTYAKYYPEYTRASLRKALGVILKKGGRLSSPTVDYYMRPRRYGGLGYGKKKKSGRR